MNVKKMLLILALSLGSFSAYSDTNYDNTQTIKTNETSVNRNREVVGKDNTALNRNKQITAESQTRGSKADIEVTRRLRAKLMADNQLSTSAHNIKIITVNEAITLKGPVANKAEKIKIENLAREMTGNKKIYNRLTY
jgi:hyperosmotically inducible protein